MFRELESNATVQRSHSTCSPPGGGEGPRAGGVGPDCGAALNGLKWPEATRGTSSGVVLGLGSGRAGAASRRRVESEMILGRLLWREKRIVFTW